jgi:hypothetical protein
MASNVIIRLECEPYLIKFLEKLYGPSPVNFPRKSNFNCILDVFLERTPPDFTRPDFGSRNLDIHLPFFELKDVRSYNYLSPTKEKIFIKEIWKYFKITYRGDIAKYIVLGLDRKDALDLFIEKYDLSQDCWDFLEKDFQRYLKIRSKKRLFRNKIISSVEGHVCPASSVGG